MNQNHNHEVVVITGSSAGVGRATAQAFAKRSARIALLARGREGLEGARQEIERLGGRAIVVPCDVADPQQVEAAADTVERELGPIDIWVNNAMATIFAPFKDISAQDFRRATEVTYLGQVYGTMAAMRKMMPRNRGTIVQVGSALAWRSIPLQSPYCGAKHAVVGFTDSLRSELLHDGSHIKLTIVHLPGLNTPQFLWGKNKIGRQPQPVPPIFDPDVAAEAIYWAAHSDRRDVEVAWSTKKAMWGGWFAPGFVDRYLASKGYSGQETGKPLDPHQPNNLYEPVPGDFGVRGPFTDRSSKHSFEFWFSKNRNWIAIGLGALAAVLIAGLGQRDRKRPASRVNRLREQLTEMVGQ